MYFGSVEDWGRRNIKNSVDQRWTRKEIQLKVDIEWNIFIWKVEIFLGNNNPVYCCFYQHKFYLWMGSNFSHWRLEMQNIHQQVSLFPEFLLDLFVSLVFIIQSGLTCQVQYFFCVLRCSRGNDMDIILYLYWSLVPQ